jgi:hypothetical protein
MTVEQLREHVEATPFRPFALLTRGGGRYPVPHPDFLLFPPDERLVVVGRPAGVCVLEADAIEGLDFTESRARSRGKAA